MKAKLSTWKIVSLVVVVVILASLILFVIPFYHEGFYADGHQGEYPYWNKPHYAPLVEFHAPLHTNAEYQYLPSTRWI